jgi:hypothetical protein
VVTSAQNQELPRLSLSFPAADSRSPQLSILGPNAPQTAVFIKATVTSKAITMDPKSGLTLPNSEEGAAGLDWDNVNNVDNPRNWPVWKKILHSAIPAVYGLALYV